MCEKIICLNLGSSEVPTISFMHLMDLPMILPGLDPFVVEFIPEGYLRPKSSRKASHRTEVKSVYNQQDGGRDARDENGQGKTKWIQKCHG